MDRDLTILVLMCYYERPNMATVALRSVLDQTYGNWRLAIVDDGSVQPIAPIAKRILEPVIERVTIYETGDSPEQKSAEGGSRFAAFWNRAIKEIPADVAIMLCDDDALLPDYLENLNAWFCENANETYCHSHVRIFDPFELTDLASIAPTSYWLNKTGRIHPSSQVDASQVAWRTSCQLEGGIWFPSPLTVSVDAAFYNGMYSKYGDCPFSGFAGQYKGLHQSQLSNRGDTYGHVRDLERPYEPPLRTVPLFKVNMSPDASQRVANVLESGYIGQGPVVEEFEQRFHALVGTDVRPLFMNSCTSAITLALDIAGVGHADEVVTTPMTCLATNLPILHRGAQPVWADVDPVTGLIDPDDALRKITKRTRAIIAVDWAGRSCDYHLLKSAGIPVIQDAAHRLYPSEVGGDYVCWSFQAIKFLTTGDGGALLVPEGKYEQAKQMRWFGLDRTSSESFRCSQNIEHAGYKFQPNDIAAAIGVANIDLATDAVKKTRSNAEWYIRELAGLDGVEIPPADSDCNWWLFTILVDPDKQQAFIDHLAGQQVVSSKVHARNDLQRAFAASAGDPLPGVDSFSSREVAIPVGSWLSEADRRLVVDSILTYSSSVAPVSR